MIDMGSEIINSIIGGLILGFATTLHLYLQGKITGMSGICFNCITLTDINYNASFIGGMIFFSSIVKCFFEGLIKPLRPSDPVFVETISKYVGDLSLIGFMLSGFLVGFGSKLANGCPSGHGLCGLPRLSQRSIAAVVLFLIFGGLTATLRYYFSFLRPFSYAAEVWEYSFIKYFMFLLSLLIITYFLFKAFTSGQKEKVRDIGVAFIIGILFSFGLMQSGMIQRHLIVDFLTLSGIWNSRLIFVLGSAVGFNFFSFNYILNKVARPRYKEQFELPEYTNIDNKLIVGAAIFGIGWGLSGICPGTLIVLFYEYCPQTLLFLFFMCLGMYVEYTFDKKITDPIDRNPLLNKVNKFKRNQGKSQGNDKEIQLN